MSDSRHGGITCYDAVHTGCIIKQDHVQVSQDLEAAHCLRLNQEPKHL